MDRLQQAPDQDALRDAMAGLGETFGLSKFAYLGFPRPAPFEPVLISTYPVQWTDHYFGRRYHDIDPVVAETRSSLLPFVWDGERLGIRGSNEQRRFFGEATEFGINSGFAVPIHDSHGGVAVVSFASDQQSDQVRKSIDERRHIFHLASLYFHVHARQKLEMALECRCPHLSPREITCLQWVVRGKSAWDIGEILSISRRTVVFHLENAKRKLNAVTLPQAVAIALHNRLIEF